MQLTIIIKKSFLRCDSCMILVIINAYFHIYRAGQNVFKRVTVNQTTESCRVVDNGHQSNVYLGQKLTKNSKRKKIPPKVSDIEVFRKLKLADLFFKQTKLNDQTFFSFCKYYLSSNLFLQMCSNQVPQVVRHPTYYQIFRQISLVFRQNMISSCGHHK